jgi:hypothetical protein
MDNDQLINQVIRRLDIIIALEIERSSGPDGARPATKIYRLHELGLPPAEIADILRKPTNYITATLSRQKGKKAKEK